MPQIAPLAQDGGELRPEPDGGDVREAPFDEQLGVELLVVDEHAGELDDEPEEAQGEGGAAAGRLGHGFPGEQQQEGERGDQEAGAPGPSAVPGPPAAIHQKVSGEQHPRGEDEGAIPAPEEPRAGEGEEDGGRVKEETPARAEQQPGHPFEQRGGEALPLIAVAEGMAESVDVIPEQQGDGERGAEHPVTGEGEALAPVSGQNQKGEGGGGQGSRSPLPGEDGPADGQTAQGDPGGSAGEEQPEAQQQAEGEQRLAEEEPGVDGGGGGQDEDREREEGRATVPERAAPGVEQGSGPGHRHGRQGVHEQAGGGGIRAAEDPPKEIEGEGREGLAQGEADEPGAIPSGLKEAMFHDPRGRRRIPNSCALMLNHLDHCPVDHLSIKSHQLLSGCKSQEKCD
jgi:hypothetical protein